MVRFHRSLNVFRSFCFQRRAVAAVEFALVAPLLLLMLGASVEVGRLMMAYRKFENVVAGVARHVVRYPEYEYRAREYAKPIPKSLFPEIDQSSLNLIVASLNKQGGALKEVFPPNVLFGVNPSLPWASFIKQSDYVDDETVVFIGATYNYKPLFSIGSTINFKFEKQLTIIPSFGRNFPWNDGQVADKYVY